MSAALDQAKQTFRDAEAALAEQCLQEAKTEIRRLLPNAASFEIEGDYDDDGDKRGRLLCVLDANGLVIVDRDRDWGEGICDELWEDVEGDMIDWYVTLTREENLQTIQLDPAPAVVTP